MPAEKRWFVDLELLAAGPALPRNGNHLDLQARAVVGHLELDLHREVRGHLHPVAQALLEELDLVVAGTKDAVMMVESEAYELTEDEMLGAVLFAHQEMQVVIKAVQELAAEAGKPKWNWEAPVLDEGLLSAVEERVRADLGEAYRITVSFDRTGFDHDIRRIR